MGEHDWKRRDGIVLTALPRFRSAGLSHVIGAYDALNHDVLPRDELEASLRRLSGAGLASVGDRFRLTPRGRKLVRQGKGRGMIDIAISVADALVQQQPPPTELPDWGLEGATYEEALQAYYDRHGIGP